MLTTLVGCAAAEEHPTPGTGEPTEPPIVAWPDAEPDTATPEPDAATPELDTITPAPVNDPFAPLPDTSEGLLNVSADLEALLEGGELAGACEAYEASPDDRRLKLLCGKSMFFYEGFGTVGVPAAIFDFFGQNFPDTVGLGYSGYGLVLDPFSEQDRPLGAAPGAPLGGLETVAFTCAMCHFGQLPDGRFAVGAPNYDYDYGAHVLTIAIPAGRVAPGFDPAEHHPDAIADVQPVLDALDADAGLRLELLFDLLPLISAVDGAQPTLTQQEEGWYAHWETGTMDFMMTPLPLDDGVHTVSKILPLWSVPTEDEVEAHGMPHAMYAWTGGATSLMQFLDGFVAIGDGTAAEWTHERLEPLAAYIESLRPPVNLSPPPEADVAGGEAALTSAHLADGTTCLACPDGPRGMGREIYTFEEIGTDEAMRLWADPDGDGQPCCGIGEGEEGELSGGLKAPRLLGLWASDRFLHNGAVHSLDELLCLGGPRPAGNDELAFQNVGHTFGCDTLTDEDKRALIAYLNAH